MTQEDKQLLLKDLCSRLPYMVKVCCITLSDEMPKVWDLIGLPTPLLADIIVDGKYRFPACEIENIRPYLRPLSSMTKEEREYMEELSEFYCTPDKAMKKIDFYLERHLDFRGLIKKGLALEASKGMYKID